MVEIIVIVQVIIQIYNFLNKILNKNNSNIGVVFNSNINIYINNGQLSITTITIFLLIVFAYSNQFRYVSILTVILVQKTTRESKIYYINNSSTKP